MTLTFLNYQTGNSAPYTGYNFYTPITLLSEIQSTLNSAGWSSISYSSGSYLFVQGNSIVGSYPCYIYFSISNSGTSYTLTLRAYLTGTTSSGIPNGTASPASTHTATFYYNGISSGSSNILWITADAEAGCICIYNANTQTSVGLHFGFLQRLDTSDANAWMIGYIHNLGYSWAYVANSLNSGTTWKQLSNDYYGYGVFGSAYYTTPASTYDQMAQIQNNTGSNQLDTSGYNTAYLAYNGRINYEGSYLIYPYFYQEGRGSTTAYGSSGNTTLYFRGFVKYAYTGVSAMIACNIVVDSITSNVILSTGNTQWQGMRIY